MQFTLKTIAAVAALLSGVQAHLSMTQPEMFANHKQNEGFVLNPLDPSGSDFPCQGGTPDATIPSGNKYELGSSGTLQIQGSAVHSGGSGQVVISYKFPPSNNQDDWYVLTSYQGNHPINVDGNLPEGDNNSIAPMQFKVHESLPKGKAIIAWNWFNKSGNREHYMKCATVSIGGSEEEVPNAQISELPTMFRANSDGGKCTVPEGVSSIKFKNPGPDVIGQGETEVPCDYSKAGSAGNGEGSDSDSGDSEGGNGEETPVEPEPVTPSEPKPVEPKPQPPVTPEPATPPSGGACTEGAVTCNSDGTWSLCGSGMLHKMGPLASGTKCDNGAISKRSVRFSAAHTNRRRHH
jgi:hypothetical protein